MPKSFLLHISQWNASSKVVSALHFKPQKSSKYQWNASDEEAGFFDGFCFLTVWQKSMERPGSEPFSLAQPQKHAQTCFLRLWRFCVTFGPVGAPCLEPSLSATFAGQNFWPDDGWVENLPQRFCFGRLLSQLAENVELGDFLHKRSFRFWEAGHDVLGTTLWVVEIEFAVLINVKPWVFFLRLIWCFRFNRGCAWSRHGNSLCRGQSICRGFALTESLEEVPDSLRQLLLFLCLRHSWLDFRRRHPTRPLSMVQARKLSIIELAFLATSTAKLVGLYKWLSTASSS